MIKMSITNLYKSYGSKKALSDFNFEFAHGIYGPLGANGAGKTTLMNIISCNIEKSSGIVSVAGMKGNIMHQIGYMPQQQALYDDFSARSFMLYMASLKKTSQPKKQVAELLEAVNLTEVAHKKCGSFSGGMRQRVLLAQAL